MPPKALRLKKGSQRKTAGPQKKEASSTPLTDLTRRGTERKTSTGNSTPRKTVSKGQRTKHLIGVSEDGLFSRYVLEGWAIHISVGMIVIMSPGEPDVDYSILLKKHQYRHKKKIYTDAVDRLKRLQYGLKSFVKKAAKSDYSEDVKKYMLQGKMAFMTNGRLTIYAEDGSPYFSITVDLRECNKRFKLKVQSLVVDCINNHSVFLRSLE